MNISVKKLAEINKIINVDLIYAGNKIVIDGSTVIFQNSKGDAVAKSIVKTEDKIISNQPVSNSYQSTPENGIITSRSKHSTELQEEDTTGDKVNDNGEITTKKDTKPTQAEDSNPDVLGNGSIQISPVIPDVQKVPSIVNGQIGNSGKVFDTSEEAISFGEKQGAANDNIKGYNLLAIEYSDGSIKYTVDFY